MDIHLIPLIMPPFRNECASKGLYIEWNYPDDSPISSKVTKNVAEFLLAKVNKTLLNFKKRPHFCHACVNKAFELSPDLIKTNTANRSLQGEQQPEDDLLGADYENQEPKLKRQRTGTFQSEDPQKVVIDFNDLTVAHLTNEQRTRLIHELALFEAKNIRESALKLTKDRDIEQLLQMDISKYLSEFNPVLCAFVCGVSGMSIDDYNSIVKGESLTYDTNVTYSLCKTIETILNLCATHVVLPVHFRESIILYVLTGSKLALTTIAAASPYGSYQTVKSWLSTLSNKPSKVSEGDLLAVFDNNQILQRRWRVKLNNTVHCNVCTMVIYFEIGEHGSLQHETLCPHEWMSQAKPEEEAEFVKNIDKREDIKETHYHHLHQFLEQVIAKVYAEQVLKDDKCSDRIDEEVRKQEFSSQFKECFHCGNKEVPKSKRNCPTCNNNIKMSERRASGVDNRGTYTEKVVNRRKSVEEYRVKDEVIEGGPVKLQYEKVTHIRSEYSKFQDRSDKKPPLHVHEPVFVHPCSYDSVAVVLRNIGEASGILQYGTGMRKWIVVVCDGVPYNLCRRVIQSSNLCLVCNESCNGRDQCVSHANDVHNTEYDELAFQKEFGWVLLQPGPGHVEMNMVKSFVELTWDVYWKSMVKIFNFKSEAALKSANKVTDHHKGWTLCRILREAATAELVLPFVRAELKKTQPCLTPEAFFKFAMDAVNPNYTFMSDSIMELMDSVFLYRAGVRCGDIKFMESGRAKFSKVWSARNHPLYRELEMADSLALARMPKEILQFVQKTMSLNTSGTPYTGEGADFRLEEVNRVIQQWLPKVPSGKDWQMVCNNHDDLVMFRDRVFGQMGISDPSSGRSSIQDISQEVTSFRTLLRSKKYLLHPDKEVDHISLDGDRLHPSLKHFCQSAREKRASYFNAFTDQEVTHKFSKASAVSFTESQVFVTREEGEEHSRIENKTVKEICPLIEDMLDHILDEDARDTVKLVMFACSKYCVFFIFSFMRVLINATPPDVRYLKQMGQIYACFNYCVLMHSH